MAVEKMLLNGVEFEVTLDGERAVVEVKEDTNPYLKEAEAAGFTKKQLKEFADFQHTYVRKAVDTSVEKAKEVLKENSNVQEVEVILPAGINKSDKVETLVIREREVRVPGTGETIVKPAIKVAVETKLNKVSKAHIKALRDELAEAIAN